jgi:hypothetical protein
MVAPGEYNTERVDDFAPRIATGTETRVREGFWDAWSQTGITEGIDQLTFSSAKRIYRSDGNIFPFVDQDITLHSAWNSTDASKVATAPMIVDFGASTVLAAIGTKVRRTTDDSTWTDSSTTLGASAVWLHRHGSNVFAACGTGADLYLSSDGNTWTQPASGQKASCFTTWEKPDGNVFLVLGTGSTIKTSTDNGSSWSSAINVGNPESNVTGLSVAFGLLIIGKEDAIFWYDGTNLNEITGFYNQKYSGNCKALVYHDGFMYTHILGRIVKISLSSGIISNMIDITPLMTGDENKDLHSHGIPIWIWSGPFHLYAAFDQGESNLPEVLAYNGIGWHQMYRGTADDTMKAAGYSRNLARSYLNDGATRSRRHTVLRDTPFAGYPTTGNFETSDFDGGMPFMLKAYRDISVDARNLSTDDGRKIVVSYSTDKGTNYTALGDITADGKTVLPFSEADITTTSKHLRLKFTLTRGSDASETPVIERFTTSFLLRPDPIRAYQVGLLLGGTRLRDGTAETKTVREQLEFLKELEGSENPVRFVDMLGWQHLVYVTKTSVLRPSEEQLAANQDERQAQVVMVDATSGPWPQISVPVDATVSVSVVATDSPPTWDNFDWDFAEW